ncbi:MAG: hypothetical protein ACRD1V_04365, partial [Vicinamibacterales bacterium]
LGFWYTPRPNVAPDGRWVLFTSNWEKTLGTDPRADATERARQDVLLLKLKTPLEQQGRCTNPTAGQPCRGGSN